MVKKTTTNYQSISEELEQILLLLQDPNTDIDRAIVLYGRGNEVVKELKNYLESAKNTVEKINIKSKSSAKD